MTDRQTDGRPDIGDCNIPDAFLKKRGDNHVLGVKTSRFCHICVTLLWASLHNITKYVNH